MGFAEQQKHLQVEMFGNKGGGQFGSKTYEIALQEQFRTENLYQGIRDKALAYFQAEAIDWWRGERGLPTNLTIATQIACLNHLFWLSDQPEAVHELVKRFHPEFEAVPFVNGRWIEFEYNGCQADQPHSYLQENSSKRGHHTTCFSAAILARWKHKKVLIAIAWQYCEKYYQKAKAIDDDDPIYCNRQQRFKPLLLDEQCPLDMKKAGLLEESYETGFKHLAVEPYYRMMSQTVLAWQLVRNKIENIDQYLYIHMIPKHNTLLLQGETSPAICDAGMSINQGWQRVLADDKQYQWWDPCELLMPIVTQFNDELGQYLYKRYWRLN